MHSMLLTIARADGTRSSTLILDEHNVVVGSDRSCTVVISDDPLVAARHLGIDVRSHGFEVRPFAPAMYQGQPMTGPVDCAPGASFRIGDTLIVPERYVHSGTWNPPRPR